MRPFGFETYLLIAAAGFLIMIPAAAAARRFFKQDGEDGANLLGREPVLLGVINAVFWAACAHELAVTYLLLPALAVSVLLIIISAGDIKNGVIPDRLSAAVLVAGVLWNLAAAASGQGNLLENVIGLFAASGILFALALATKGGVGGGDIKLMAACGLIIGWRGGLMALGLAAVLGTIVMLPLFFAGRTKGRTLPFGPFLSAGVMTMMMFGQQITGWYSTLF